MPNISSVDMIKILDYNDKILHSMNKVKFRCLIFRVGLASHLNLHPPYILGSCTSTVTLSVWFGTAVLLMVVSLVVDIWDLLEVGDTLLLAWLPRCEPW
jgi:hypothetical protein